MSERVEATTKRQETIAKILAANDEFGFSRRFHNRFCSRWDEQMRSFYVHQFIIAMDDFSFN